MRVARHWIDRAREALASARAEAAAGRLPYAVNRAYYAAFYAASAVLLVRGHRFKKHAGVRDAFHKHLVRGGFLSEAWGRFYDELFHDRQVGDYAEFPEFDPAKVAGAIDEATQLVAVLEALLPPQGA